MKLRGVFLTMAAVAALATMTGCPTPADNAARSYGIVFGEAGTRGFHPAQVGYIHVDPLVVRVYNTGDTPSGDLRIAIMSDDFMLSRSSLPSIAVGQNETFTVVPVTGLDVGLHTARIKVYGTLLESRYFDVYFRVAEELRDITSDFTCLIFLRLIRLVLDIPAPQPIFLHDAQDIHGMNISAAVPELPMSLGGIENFTNLRYLTMFAVHLYYVDFSSNQQLRYLNIEGNHGRILEIDVSFLDYLESLVMFDADLRSIRFGYQPNLRHVDLSGNHLAELDVSTLYGLEVLLLYGVRTLDYICVRYNPNLIALQLSYMGLTGTVDLSKNPRLVVLFIEGNALNSICVRYNLALEHFVSWNNEGISEVDFSNNRALVHIGLASTRITELDLSYNVNLLRLIANFNSYLHTIHWPEENNLYNIALTGGDRIGSYGSLTRFVPNAPNLRYVSVTSQPLEYINLSQMPNLEVVRFSGRMTDTSSDYMDFRGSDRIRELIIRPLSTGDNLVYFDAYDFPPTVIDLGIQGGDLRQIRNLDRFTRLREIFLCFNYLEELDISENMDLRLLNVSGNRLRTLDLRDLRNLWFLGAEYNHLTRVYVEGSGLGAPNPTDPLDYLPTVNLAFNYLRSIDYIIGYRYLPALRYGHNLDFRPQRDAVDRARAPQINTDMDWLTPVEGGSWRLPDIRVGEEVQWQFELLYHTYLHDRWVFLLPAQGAAYYGEGLYLCRDTGILTGATRAGHVRDWHFYIFADNVFGWYRLRVYLRVLPAAN